MRISDWSSDVCSSDLYLEDAGEWTLRCRRTSTLNRVQCFLTMKRRISNERCVELESPVDAQFYEDMASQCGPALTKTRSKITRSEEHTSELQSLMRISYAVFCLKKTNTNQHLMTHVLL